MKKQPLFVCAILLIVSFVAAQQSQTVPAINTAEKAKDEKMSIPLEKFEPAKLNYVNREIFTFRGVFLNLTPQERAEAAEQRLNNLKYDDLHRQELRTNNVGGNRIIQIGKSNLFAITPEDLDPESGETVDQASQKAIKRLQEAFQAKIQQLSVPFLIRAIAISLGSTLAFFLFTFFLFRLRRVVSGFLQRRTEERKYTFEIFGHDFKERALAVLRSVISILGWTLFLIVAYVWITYVLGLFPYSRPWADNMASFLFNTIKKLSLGFLNSIPGLATVALIFIIARFITRLVTDFFKGVEAGRVSAPIVLAETASATRRMINALVWLFALVIAYPYIPGSHTDAFKGISVFIGLMFTIGSAGVVNHMMSGLVLVYSRALKKGDYVRVGETEGRVLEVGPLSTKIMNRRNEEITIPNTVMVGTTITNYSRLSKDNGIIVTTKVTIGYDAPWRQVQALLLMAADRTEDLRKTPSPFVLQTELTDFYVEYMLGAYLDIPEKRILVLSKLHSNIQDAFNEYGVQIMSPNFEAQPDKPVTVEKSRWYASPAQGI